jgi:hypothetical protein
VRELTAQYEGAGVTLVTTCNSMYIAVNTLCNQVHSSSKIFVYVFRFYDAWQRCTGCKSFSSNIIRFHHSWEGGNCHITSSTGQHPEVGDIETTCHTIRLEQATRFWVASQKCLRRNKYGCGCCIDKARESTHPQEQETDHTSLRAKQGEIS